jgi:hypothetical protein
MMLLCFLVSCKERSKQEVVSKEDMAAKKMLQGIWVNEDGQDVAFRAKGDTIYYADAASMPVYFQIINDTMVLHGADVVKYPILKQTANLFIFKNQNGEDVKLVHSTDQDDLAFFNHSEPLVLNQNKLIKRDTVVTYEGEKYHCYVQVNPTTYKVIKVSYNDEGVEVNNIYHDNIVNLNVYHGAKKLFSGDFRKQQFSKNVPSDFLQQAVLSDLVFKKIDEKGISYTAILVMPDSQTSYQVVLTVNYNGRLSMRVE